VQVKNLDGAGRLEAACRSAVRIENRAVARPDIGIAPFSMTITPFGPEISSRAGGTEQSPTNVPDPISWVTTLDSVSAIMTVPTGPPLPTTLEAAIARVRPLTKLTSNAARTCPSGNCTTVVGANCSSAAEGVTVIAARALATQAAVITSLGNALSSGPHVKLCSRPQFIASFSAHMCRNYNTLEDSHNKIFV
jgi:hypothetical protein